MNLHAVILAGGSGSRFWPLSREMAPKQMLDVFGVESLLVAAVKRAAVVCSGGALLENQGVRSWGSQKDQWDTHAERMSHGAIWIVVGERLYDEVRNHLKAHAELRPLDIRYIVEPCSRNTAPAFALAAATVKLADSSAQIVMLPSDHICDCGEEWVAVITAAREAAARGNLVTIGLRPTYAATGYGYIKVNTAEPASGALGSEPAAQACRAAEVRPARRGSLAEPVERFVEKPDAATAQEYVTSGNYLWNSGMLVASAAGILKELRRLGALYSSFGELVGQHEAAEYDGKIATVAETLADGGADAWQNEACRFLYADCPSVPFDTACLEVAQNVSVVAADLGWSDVGSLEALDDLQEPDPSSNNTLIGRTVDVDSCDTLVYSQSGRVIATLGLDNIMVIDSADATLIAARDRVQDVRQIVDALKAQDAPEITQSKTSLRPWGSWTMLVRMPGYHVKEVSVNPSARLSSQSHEYRAEHWIVAQGTALVTVNGGTITLNTNESAFLPIGTVHRLENIGEGTLRIVEVATGEYLGEDDITRYDDDFGR